MGKDTRSRIYSNLRRTFSLQNRTHLTQRVLSIEYEDYSQTLKQMCVETAKIRVLFETHKNTRKFEMERKI